MPKPDFDYHQEGIYLQLIADTGNYYHATLWIGGTSTRLFVPHADLRVFQTLLTQGAKHYPDLKFFSDIPLNKLFPTITQGQPNV